MKRKDVLLYKTEDGWCVKYRIGRAYISTPYSNFYRALTEYMRLRRGLKQSKTK
ncbi:MAG: hypothetical protein J5714_01700 [Alphaproteobacteria bacterium]|nr:hypothetical protein [Alphaproteobacteria bacterium]